MTQPLHAPPAPVTILVTWSRHWSHPHVVHAALDEAAGNTPPERVTVLHGANRGGADAQADAHARARGWSVRTFPGTSRNGLLARNRAMIALNPDVVLAFVAADSRGTWHTITQAQASGLLVRAYGEPATVSDVQACRAAAAVLTGNRGWANPARRALAIPLSAVQAGRPVPPGLLDAARHILEGSTATA